MDLESLKREAFEKIEDSQSLKSLNEVWREYLGRKGRIRSTFKEIKDLPDQEKKEKGRKINQIKQEIEEKIKQKKTKIVKPRTSLDITLPGEKPEIGNLHPLTKILSECEEIFKRMGFQVVEGPEIENEWYNFDALNIPPHHPARDLWDTLWIENNSENNSENLLLRTHTSPMQARFMENNNPPFRIIVPGRVFRHEATDSSHEIQFYQLEGLAIDKELSLTNLKAVLAEFFKLLLGENIKVRFRPGYFPFTEPSLEADILMPLQEEWLEMLGGGMVHPNVLKAVGYNPNHWQGFAFGMGIDRLAMTKYKINDVRLLYSGDLEFLDQE